jgi:hypothetical protein
MSRLDTVRQHLRVPMHDGTSIEAWTSPAEYRVQALTWKRHPEWPTREEDPVTFLMFMAWAAARRAGDIAMDLKFEAFVAAAADVQELAGEAVDPTGPAPGAG